MGLWVKMRRRLDDSVTGSILYIPFSSYWLVPISDMIMRP